MWTYLKYAGLAFGGLLVLGAVGLFAFIYFASRAAHRNAAAIEELCQTPIGTPIEKILPRARQLGIHEEGPLSALGQAITINCTDAGAKVDESSEDLPGFNNGTITLGKTVVVPFERHYCEIRIENRRVVATAKRVLD